MPESVVTVSEASKSVLKSKSSPKSFAVDFLTAEEAA